MAQFGFHIVVEVMSVEMELGKAPLTGGGALQGPLNAMLQLCCHFLRIIMVMYTFFASSIRLLMCLQHLLRSILVVNDVLEGIT